MARALPPSSRQTIQSARAGAAQRGAPLRSRRPALRVVSRRRPAIQLRLFRDRRAIAGRRPACEEAPPGGEAPRPAGPAAGRQPVRVGGGWAPFPPAFLGARPPPPPSPPAPLPLAR